MSNRLYRLGRFAARRPWVVLGSWLLMAVLVVGASSAFGEKLDDSFGAPGLDSQKATDLLSASGSDRAGLTAQVVLTPHDEDATFFDSAEARAALAQVQTAVSALPRVLTVSDPSGALEDGRAAAASSGAISPDGRVALIRVQYPVLDELDPVDLENLKELGSQARAGSPLQVELGGDLFFAFEEAEAGTGEAIGLIAAVIILLLAFGSIIAMGLPIGMALFGLALGISSMSLITYLVDIPRWAPVVASMVGLGVGIDYALFLVTRHREYLAQGLTVEESVGRSVATAGQSVVFAGGTVVIAILGLAVAGVPFMTAGGIAVSVIVLIMVLTSVTLLPAFLGLAGHRINGCARATEPPRGRVSGLWMAALGWPRVAARPRLRHRRHRRAAGTDRTRRGAPGRHPRRGRAPVAPHRAIGLRPRRRRIRTRDQRATRRRGRHLQDPERARALGHCHQVRQGRRIGRIPGNKRPTPESRHWWPSRPPGPRTAPPSKRSNGSAPM